ncbi:MAG: acyl-CoA dehydrogenase family protein [Deltaproteobacteria bacterium]|nr:acyl-CoA dehydrogenase family protein [Deltaproteobacteria bacterium]
MQFEPNDADLRITELARSAARDHLAPRAMQTDAGVFPAENIGALGSIGLLGIKIDRHYGGLGGSNLAYVLAIRELAAQCASTTVAVAVTNMVADMIARFGTDDQKVRHLRNLVSGAYQAGSFALSEPGAGSDAASLQTRAERRGDDWVLNGTKLWITSGDVAGVTLVMAKTDPGKGGRGITAFLVEPGTAGFSVGRHEEKLGLLGSSTVSLAFEDVVVPDAARIGAVGQGFEIAMTALDGGRCGIGAQASGMGYTALRETSRILSARAGQDKALGTDQNAQFRLADMAVRLDAAWLLVQRAAWLRDQGSKMTKEAAMAKVAASEAANFACQTAMQLAGPDAFDAGSTIARVWRDVRVSRIYEGTSEIQRLVIARSLAAAL